MDYEELYAKLQPLEKKLKEMNASLQKLHKNMVKDTEYGDLRSLSKNLAAYSELVEGQTKAAAEIRELVDSFDGKAYLESGDFAQQMLSFCQAKGVDVTGEYPVYEMFPYRVRFDTENQDIYLDRKKILSLRPQSFVQTVKAGQEKLMKANFNDVTFLGELADAYDTALMKMGKKQGYELYLNTLYKFLVPMARSRKEYDQQSFAFDLARLYMSDVETTKNGRMYQFGHSRNHAKEIRILDLEGNEHFLGTIRFFAPSAEEDDREK